jgi:hypothetical protein
MKTTSQKIILAAVAGIFSILNTYGQNTELSGTGANTCGAGTGAGTDNTSVGCSAGASLGSGAMYNVALGLDALYSNSTGDYNTAIGWQAGLFNTTMDNTFLGAQTGYKNSTGTDNTFLGEVAGYSNQTGNGCTLVGQQAGYYNTGSYNTTLGYVSGFLTTTGYQNCFIGSGAGANNTTGYNNICLGYNSNMYGGLNNSTAIGANTKVLVSNNVVLGDNNSFVGIRLSNNGTGALSPLSVGGNGNSAYEINGYNGSLSSGSQGIHGECPSNGGSAYGVVGTVPSGNGFTYGVYGSSTNSTAASAGRSYGVYGLAGNATSGYNYAVYGRIVGTNNGAAVFGTTAGDADVGATGSAGKFAGYFNGDLLTTDDAPEKPTSGSWTGYSDKRLKKDIAPFKDGIEVLRKINTVTYQFNGIGGLPVNKTFIGVIAQDVEKVAPYCVTKGSLRINQSDVGKFGGDVLETTASDTAEGTSVVSALKYNYDGLIYVLINSVKQLDSSATAAQKQAAAQQATAAATKQADDNRIAVLEAENAQMKNDAAAMKENMAAMQQQLNNFDKALSQCCMSYQQHAENASGNTVSDAPALQQNNPNPFSENTTIRFYIPQNVKNAVIKISTMNGTELKTFEITQRGNGELLISANALNAGTYNYALIIDGSKVDSKIMVLSK